MIETRQNGGMTEYIPTPSEKRDSLIRDHLFTLLANLDDRLHRLESGAGLPPVGSHQFKRLLHFIKQEEGAVQALQTVLDQNSANKTN